MPKQQSYIVNVNQARSILWDLALNAENRLEQMHMTVCVVVAGIKQQKEKRILRNEHESVDKKRKVAKLASFFN